MPESPIRIYLPEKRPADVRPRQPHWFSAEVSATVLTQLQNIGPTANWTEAINAIALAATGRYAPVIGDIVTLHRGTDSFRREWNGFRWIYIEPYLDGDNIYIESLLANTLSGDIDADRIRAKNVTTPLLLANSFEGGKWKSNALFADHARIDRTIIDESVQVGFGTISFDNLSDEIIAPVSVSVSYQNLPQTIASSLPAYSSPLQPTFGGNVYFTRNAINENIVIHVRPTLDYLLIGEPTGFFGSRRRERINRAAEIGVRVSVGPSEQTRTTLTRTPLIFNHDFNPDLVTPLNERLTGTFQYPARSISVPLSASPIGVQRLVFVEVAVRYDFSWVSSGNNRRTPQTEAGWLVGDTSRFRGQARSTINLQIVIQEARPFG